MNACFHPKLVCALVEDADGPTSTGRKLIVACQSANLTRAGWRENLECSHTEVMDEGVHSSFSEIQAVIRDIAIASFPCCAPPNSAHTNVWSPTPPRTRRWTGSTPSASRMADGAADSLQSRTAGGAGGRPPHPAHLFEIPATSWQAQGLYTLNPHCPVRQRAILEIVMTGSSHALHRIDFNIHRRKCRMRTHALVLLRSAPWAWRIPARWLSASERHR